MEIITKLSECEELLMKIIWSASTDPDLNTITEQLKIVFSKEWKPQTTATVLKRLEQKKFISVYKVGRYLRYRPIVDFKIYQKMKLNKLLHLWFDGDKKVLHAAIEEWE